MCRVFKIVHVKQTMFLGCIELQLCATCNVISHVKYVLYFYSSTHHSMCAVLNMTVFSSSLISCFPGMLLRYCLE
jgi:hypothetical protein